MKSGIAPAFVAACVLLLACPCTRADAYQPNIVVILADDLGCGEVGYNGHPFAKTPHIDSIVANGVAFTNGYCASSVCSPSRAGLVTGRYPTRFGVEGNSGKPGCGLPTSEKTIANRLRELGYATSCFGKLDL